MFNVMSRGRHRYHLDHIISMPLLDNPSHHNHILWSFFLPKETYGSVSDHDHNLICQKELIEGSVIIITIYKASSQKQPIMMTIIVFQRNLFMSQSLSWGVDKFIVKSKVLPTNCSMLQLYPSDELSQITSHPGITPPMQWQSISCEWS